MRFHFAKIERDASVDDGVREKVVTEIFRIITQQKPGAASLHRTGFFPLLFLVFVYALSFARPCFLLPIRASRMVLSSTMMNLLVLFVEGVLYLSC